MSERFDLVVIGSGPAGEKAAARAAYFGKRVAIVERRPTPGGAAIANAGLPAKTLRETALFITGFQQRDVYGLSLELDPQAALQKLMSRKAAVVKTMTDAVRENIERHGIELVHGEATLGPNRSVRVNTHTGTRVLDADIILIATGSRPSHPPGIPFDDPDVYDSEEILELKAIPQSMLVVGGGPVGCEYASVFTALGVKVTLVTDEGRLLQFMDSEISQLLAETFQTLGMRVMLGVGVSSIERSDGLLQTTLANGEVLHPEKILFAAGRIGNTGGLGLEEAGVELDSRGRIVVDSTFRTTAPDIYAAGDVIGPPALASVAMEQGRLAMSHAFGLSFQVPLDPLPPFAVYTIPEVAMVGMAEEVARGQGINCETGRASLARNTRANITGSTEGLVKLVFRKEDLRLLGVHILGNDAGELIHLGQAILHQGGGIDHFINTTFNFPTLSEAYKYAAYDGLGRIERKILTEP
jgi:NAD(P) transhydrogenase